MTERKGRKEAETAPPVIPRTEKTAWHGGSDEWGRFESGSFLKHLRRSLSLTAYCTPVPKEERGGDDPILSFVSYRSDEEEFRAWLIKKYGPITDEVTPEVRQWLSEIDRSVERMRRDQEEIDRLKEETRAAIARLEAA